MYLYLLSICVRPQRLWYAPVRTPIELAIREYVSVLISAEDV